MVMVALISTNKIVQDDTKMVIGGDYKVLFGDIRCQLISTSYRVFYTLYLMFTLC